MKAEWTNADNLTSSQATGKSVLVIDTPKNCSECKLIFLQGIVKSICNAVDWEERPSWCPLKPMPNKKEENDDSTHFSWHSNDWWSAGWNACLEEIENESDNNCI